jgi:predicted acetyltransferase
MLTFAQKTDIDELKNLWKTIFEDTDFFVDLYFSEKFNPDNTLIFKEKEKIIAALYMDLYQFRFWGATINCCYLSGLGTLPEARNRGIMSKLIVRSNELMRDRNIPLAILVPANKKMFDFYGKFDCEQVFEANEMPIPLEKIVDKKIDFCKKYEEFNEIYSQKDFCIQKTFADFNTIIADWEHDKRPIKTNIAGMARLVLPEKMFDIYQQKTGNKLSLNLSDKSVKIMLKNNVLSLSLRQLCRLLFGYKTSKFPTEISRFFPENNPILNLMLE